MGNKKDFGNWGESIAECFLINQGINIIGKNIFTPYGELDLIGLKDDIYVIFEVKTRSNNEFGNPENAISTLKRKHIIESALHYLQANDLLDATWRVDVIAIQKTDRKNVKIKWFQDAIRAE